MKLLVEEAALRLASIDGPVLDHARLAVPKSVDGTAIGVLVTVALAFITILLTNFRRKAAAERDIDQRAVSQIDVASEALKAERQYTRELLALLTAEQTRVSQLVHNVVDRHTRELAELRLAHREDVVKVNARLDECEHRHGECEALVRKLINEA